MSCNDFSRNHVRTDLRPLPSVHEQRDASRLERMRAARESQLKDDNVLCFEDWKRRLEQVVPVSPEREAQDARLRELALEQFTRDQFASMPWWRRALHSFGFRWGTGR